MSKSVFFDHIEVHVKDIPRYCEFLKTVFKGGRYKVISKSGSSMFVSNDGINIEVKQNKSEKLATAAGYCNPCLRMENAKSFIEDDLQFTISKTVENPDGHTYFFDDHEGITWHIKDYLLRDATVNW